MQITVRVLASNSKWTSIQYLSSNAKSRITTKSILEQMDNGKMKAVNPDAIFGYEEAVSEDVQE